MRFGYAGSPLPARLTLNETEPKQDHLMQRKRIQVIAAVLWMLVAPVALLISYVALMDRFRSGNADLLAMTLSLAIGLVAVSSLPLELFGKVAVGATYVVLMPIAQYLTLFMATGNIWSRWL